MDPPNKKFVVLLVILRKIVEFALADVQMFSVMIRL